MSRTSGHDPLEGVSPSGMIVTGAHRNRIPSAFEPVINEAVTRLHSLGSEYSLYAYGSVATGTAVVGRSDVDLVTVGLDAARARRLGETLSADFSMLCRGVEVGAGQPSAYVGSDDRAYGNRVFLRHYCVHLAGPHVGADLPEFPADRAAARGFNGDIGQHADRWRTALAEGTDPALLGRRMARKTLLAVAGLVSVHDSTWTTNRFTGAYRWSEVVPHLRESLVTLLSWSSGASAAHSGTAVERALEGVVSEVVRDFADRIGLWSRGDL